VEEYDGFLKINFYLTLLKLFTKMEKKELKLKKESLSNLTNLNVREMEELKGGEGRTTRGCSAPSSDTTSSVYYGLLKS
jgi:hypothetical protein